MSFLSPGDGEWLDSSTEEERSLLSFFGRLSELKHCTLFSLVYVSLWCGGVTDLHVLCRLQTVLFFFLLLFFSHSCGFFFWFFFITVMNVIIFIVCLCYVLAVKMSHLTPNDQLFFMNVY